MLTPQISDVLAVAARGLWSAALQLASAICRHYWPVALLAAIAVPACTPHGAGGRRRRRGGGLGQPPAIADEDAKPIGVLTYLLLKRLDDLAYGLGLWYGVVRERNIGPLKPQIRV